jgi:hypothetical protein
VTLVQIFLHAFVINLSGLFDNWAWPSIHRHDLLAEVGGARNVGIFKRRAQQFFPERKFDRQMAGDPRPRFALFPARPSS